MIVKPRPWYPSFETNSEDLFEVCPLPLEKLSEKCESAVEEYFENLPLENLSTTWIALPNRLTYGRAFENPMLDRNRVIQALQEKQCRLEDGESVRWDLSESCHADAFANLSVFLWSCSEYGNQDFRLERMFDMSESADLMLISTEQYTRALQYNALLILEEHWLSGQCSRHELSEMRIDEQQDQEQYRALFSIAKRLRERWDQTSYVPETFVLKSLAARLGDKSTAALYYPRSSLETDDIWYEHMNKVWPWKDDVIRRTRGGSLEDAFTRLDGTRKRLEVGISLALSLQKSRLEFDWNWLVKTVCKRRKSDETTCQFAIADLDSTLEWHQETELQALDKFESVSRELNLYE